MRLFFVLTGEQYETAHIVAETTKRLVSLMECRDYRLPIQQNYYVKK